MLTDRCILCEHPFAATTVAELKAAIVAHMVYIESPQVDRATNPHYEEERLIHLMVS